MSSFPPSKCVCYTVTFLLLTTMTSSETVIDCIEPEPCQDTDIQCDAHDDCRIRCSAANACQQSVIQCPVDHQCIVTCDSVDSCLSLSILGEDSSSVQLNGCAEPGACVDMAVYCPSRHASRDNDEPNCYLDDPSDGLQIYAVNGWRNVHRAALDDGNQTLNDSDSASISATMHCGTSYMDSCDFSLDDWTCADADHPCNQLAVTSATSDGTILDLQLTIIMIGTLMALCCILFCCCHTKRSRQARQRQKHWDGNDKSPETAYQAVPKPSPKIDSQLQNSKSQALGTIHEHQQMQSHMQVPPKQQHMLGEKNISVTSTMSVQDVSAAHGVTPSKSKSYLDVTPQPSNAPTPNLSPTPDHDQGQTFHNQGLSPYQLASKLDPRRMQQQADRDMMIHNAPSIIDETHESSAQKPQRVTTFTQRKAQQDQRWDRNSKNDHEQLPGSLSTRNRNGSTGSSLFGPGTPRSPLSGDAVDAAGAEIEVNNPKLPVQTSSDMDLKDKASASTDASVLRSPDTWFDFNAENGIIEDGMKMNQMMHHLETGVFAESYGAMH